MIPDPSRRSQHYRRLDADLFGQHLLARRALIDAFESHLGRCATHGIHVRRAPQAFPRRQNPGRRELLCPHGDERREE
eukprot:7030804-Alexandrium_andersonii.AAC.1